MEIERRKKELNSKITSELAGLSEDIKKEILSKYPPYVGKDALEYEKIKALSEQYKVVIGTIRALYAGKIII